MAVKSKTAKTASKIGSLTGSVVSFVVKVALVILIITFLYNKTIEAYNFAYRVFTEEPVAVAPGRDVTVSITEGKGYWDIAKTLEEKGLVRDAKLAFIQIYTSEYRKDMKPGAYVLNTSMTAEEMFAIMAAETEEEEDSK